MEPKWEHGKRVHGYWLGIHRLGWVGIPQGKGEAKRIGYKWSFEGHGGKTIDGTARTLREAKREVEKEYKSFVGNEEKR